MKNKNDLQSELNDLRKRKFILLQQISKLEKDYNGLVNEKIKSADDWLYGLPIESLNDLDDKNLRTRLGDVKQRNNWRKASKKACLELEEIASKIKDLEIDLINVKIMEILS